MFWLELHSGYHSQIIIYEKWLLYFMTSLDPRNLQQKIIQRTKCCPRPTMKEIQFFWMFLDAWWISSCTPPPPPKKNILFGYNRTDKKENLIFLIYKEIQSGAVAKSYMTNGLLIHIWGNICAFSHILGSPSSYCIWLCNCSTLNFLIYEENLIFFFVSVSNVCLIGGNQKRGVGGGGIYINSPLRLKL